MLVRYVIALYHFNYSILWWFRSLSYFFSYVMHTHAAVLGRCCFRVSYPACVSYEVYFTDENHTTRDRWSCRRPISSRRNKITRIRATLTQPPATDKLICLRSGRFPFTPRERVWRYGGRCSLSYDIHTRRSIFASHASNWLMAERRSGERRSGTQMESDRRNNYSASE